MCDGVTQGQPGMELSLFSRDVIAMATAVALSHNVFDAVLCLGVCDKIVPGIADRRLAFRPPAGDFRARRADALGLAQRREGENSPALRRRARSGATRCWKAESKAYHAPGTCTFYGTANSNQMLMEVMGLHLPGAAFVPPNTPLRDALTQAAAQPRPGSPRSATSTFRSGGSWTNGRSSTVSSALLATGGSTNHTLHSGCDRPCRRHFDQLGRLQRLVGRGAAAGQDLSQRQGRREPLSRRRRHGFSDRRIARCRTAARRRAHRRGRRVWRAIAKNRFGQRRAGLASGAEAERR
jgi:hypothetical protein